MTDGAFNGHRRHGAGEQVGGKPMVIYLSYEDYQAGDLQVLQEAADILGWTMTYEVEEGSATLWRLELRKGAI